MTNQEYLNKIKAGLESNRADKIISAAKQLQRKYEPGFESVLVTVLENRHRADKSWEVQSELIKLVGKERINSALPIIKEIISKNLEFDTVTIHAATAYLRLSRKDLSDVEPIVTIFGNIGYSVGEGILSCLGDDFMKPSVKDQNKLLSYFWDFGNPVPLGHVDPRFGLAQAAANWDTAEAKDFIRHCSVSPDSKLRQFAIKFIEKEQSGLVIMINGVANMRTVLICAVAALFFSCEGNGIKFDINNSIVTQENGKKLCRLTIASDSVDDFYYIELKTGNIPKRQISLFDIDTNYVVTNWRGVQVEKMILQPNRVYTIENRSDGDCSPGVVSFATDSAGRPTAHI